MRPMLDPKRDLAGATPESLARALLRGKPSPRKRRKPVVPDEVPVKEPVPDKRGDGESHLREGS